MIELSAATTERLRRLFPPDDVATATHLLAERCADDLPLLGVPPTPASLERLRFAAIRVSGGDLERLREALDVAHVDWRDLLVAAGFGSDTRAHERWEPRVLDVSIAARWKTSVIADVAYRPGDRVRLVWGPARGRTGTVTGLIGLEPEARYTIRLDSGEDTPAFQKMLVAAL